MKIVLCDDQMQHLNTLVSKVDGYLKNKIDLDFQLLSYADSGQLYFDLEDKARADVYILDIDMPRVSGLDLARKIKTLYPMAMLYFYTSYVDFATEGYRLNARRYILKSGDDRYLYEALDYAVDEVSRLQNDFITVSAYRDTVNIQISDIIYAVREGRQIRIHTNLGGDYTMYGSIVKLLEKINRPSFIFIDRGTFINVRYVRRTETNAIVLLNGETLYISQKRIISVKKAIAEYWSR